MSGKAASEPGPWRNSRTPYLVEIMDCLSPASPIERVVVMKGAQLGYSEAGNNWLGHCVAQPDETARVIEFRDKRRIHSIPAGSPVAGGHGGGIMETPPKMTFPRDLLGIEPAFLASWRAAKIMPKTEYRGRAAYVDLSGAVQLLALRRATILGLRIGRFKYWWKKLGLEGCDFSPDDRGDAFLILEVRDDAQSDPGSYFQLRHAKTDEEPLPWPGTALDAGTVAIMNLSQIRRQLVEIWETILEAKARAH
jgi:hypothetical protein